LTSVSRTRATPSRTCPAPMSCEYVCTLIVNT
jgi:hypothetical protein